MRPIGTVDQQRGLGTNARKPVPHVRWDPQTNVCIRAPELDDVKLSCHAWIPVVEQCKADTPNRNGEVLGLYPMALPRLDRARCDFGEVTLAEPAKIRRVGAEHVQHSAPIIHNLSKLGHSNAADARERS